MVPEQGTTNKLPKIRVLLETIAQLRSTVRQTIKLGEERSPRLSTRLYFAIRHSSLARVEAYVNCRGLENSDSDA
jgi:hypothetical protein